METTPKHIIAILCGGTGPRLWPLSRADHPKQFLPLFSDKTLLEETWSNASKIVSPQNIYVVTNHKFAKLIKDYLPQIKPSNIISEPDKKNTAMALVYLSSLIAKESPSTVITTIPSDHHITDIKKFSQAIIRSKELTLKNKKICLIGKTPLFPNPSYGYILGNPNVKKFIEKPKGVDLAKIYNDGGLWNLGIYTFTPDILMTEISHTQKKLFPLYSMLFSSKVNQKIVDKVYKEAPNLPIDIAVSELSSNLQVVKTNFGWSDIGEWGSIYKALPSSKKNIKSLGKQICVNLNSNNCLISTYPKKIIGLNGVSNLAIIDTPDALLISNLDESLNLRNLVGQIVSDKNTENYFLKSHDHKKR